MASPQLEDITMSSDLSAQNFEELFNFDEFESSGSASTHANSPSTVSPNATPSPLPLHEPHFLSHSGPVSGSGSMSLDMYDPALDVPIGLTLNDEMSLRSMKDAVVKDEPIDFSPFSSLAFPAPSLAPAAPAPVLGQNQDVSALVNTLPFDQQAALQQLMENIIKYQQTFGMEPSANSELQTIEPSMLFSSSLEQPKNEVPAAPVVEARPARALSAVPEEIHDEPLSEITSTFASNQAEAGPSRARSDSIPFADLNSRIDSLVPLPQIFSAGKSKGGKKGGGLSSVVLVRPGKKSASPSGTPGPGEDDGENDEDDDDSWRPSPEEYKKLSSKEKRQLRNKLSARAFRTRRKDYIGTLEAHIRDRDGVIEDMREELGRVGGENVDLRKELEALKASTMSILHPESAVASAASVTAPVPSTAAAHKMTPALANALANSPALSAATANGLKRSSTLLNTYNPRKDLSPSLYKGGWGEGNMFGGGGSTVCHTMLTPDLNLPRQNMNPLLNTPSPSLSASASPLSTTSSLQSAPNSNTNPDLSSTFSSWSETNPFSLRTMDTYRMQIWGRLAREAEAEKGGLKGHLRPKFYVEGPPVSGPSRAAKEGKASSAANKITLSFLSAFSSPTGSAAGALDTDKLAAIISGQTKLIVVSVTPPLASTPASPSPSPSPTSKEEEDNLALLMGGLQMKTGCTMMGERKKDIGHGARENPLGVFCGFLKGLHTC